MSIAPPLESAIPRRRRLYWSLFAVAFALQQLALWWLYWGHAPKALAGDEVMYLSWARGVAGTAALSPPTWLWPPLQAWFMAGVFRLFGEHIAIVQVLQSLLMLASAGLLRSLWLVCDRRRRAANIAAALFLLNPSTFAYAQYLWPETLHLFLLLLALKLLTRVPWRRLRTLLAGIALGLALLAKSLLSPFWPLCALLFWPVKSWSQRVAAVALLALGVFAVTGPLLWQGWQATGKPLIADSSAFNLVGGLEDRWRSDYVDDSVRELMGTYLGSAASVRERNALFLQRARDDVAREGLVDTVESQLSRQYFRLFNAKTLLLSQLPGPACAGYIGTYAQIPLWLDALVTFSAVSLHALTLAAFAFGLVLWRRWREPLVAWTLLFFAFQLALYLPLHVKARFLLPFMPFFCAYAGSFIASCTNSERGTAVELRASVLRWIAASGLAVLLLGLAFLGPVLDRSCG